MSLTVESSTKVVPSSGGFSFTLCQFVAAGEPPPMLQLFVEPLPVGSTHSIAVSPKNVLLKLPELFQQYTSSKYHGVPPGPMRLKFVTAVVLEPCVFNPVVDGITATPLT